MSENSTSFKLNSSALSLNKTELPPLLVNTPIFSPLGTGKKENVFKAVIKSEAFSHNVAPACLMDVFNIL